MKELSRTQQKTREKFIEALFFYLEAKPLEKITVRDIVTKAGYNRSSFYLYFADVYDLADTAEDEVLTKLSSAAEQQFAQEDQIPMEIFMQKLASQVAKYADRISLLVGSATFQNKFMNLFRPTFSKVSGLNSDMKGYDYLTSLIFAVMLHNISYWSQHRTEINLLEIAEMTRNIVLPGIRQLQTMA